MRFFDDAFPLIVTVSAPVFDAAEVRSMATGFERYFGRGERYAVVTLSPPGAPMPGPRERKLINDWVNEPRVRAFSQRLCIASATVVNGGLARATLNVLLAVWKPPLPVELVPNAERGIDYCLACIREQRLPIGKSLDLMRISALAQLREVL